MKRELQEGLIGKYPEMFGHVLKPAEGPIVPIRFGLECGDGWHMLLSELMGDIQNHINNVKDNLEWEKKRNEKLSSYKRFIKKIKKYTDLLTGKSERPLKQYVPYITITQVKEKFGGLRFYYDGGDDKIDGMVSLAESLSYRICEECGTTLNIGQTVGWIVTCCKGCFDAGKTNQTKWKPYED